MNLFSINKNRPLFIAFIFYLLFQNNLQSQTTYLVLKFTDSTHTEIKNTLKPNQSFTSKDNLLKEINTLSETFNQQGFLSHHINLIKTNDSTYNGLISLNDETKDITLIFNSNEKLPSFIHNNPLTIPFNQLQNTLQHIYSHYENSGASFTEIKLDEIRSKNNKLTAKVSIRKSKNRTIDKVVVKGYPLFPKKFIRRYLKIKPSTTYNQETQERISNSLQSLDFITETRKPEVLFTKDSTHLYIYVSKKSANRFDGLVGFSNSEENGKLRFNGYLDLELNNSFHNGEKIAVFWSNNGNQQEEFRFKVATPYIFSSPITPEVNFEIYKQDSTFITIDFDLKLSYMINLKNTIGVTLKTKNSTNLLKENNSPLVNSYKTNLYGMTYAYRQVKKSNLEFSLNTAAYYGNKTSESISTPQHGLFLDFTFTDKITRRSSFYLHNRTETLRSNNLLFNELFQIGGANTIRGFYEQSIFCSSYNFTNLEYRLLTNSESYLYTFSDVGFVEDQTNETNDRLYSFGLGYAYKTKGGVINLNYAFGKKNNNPFDFNQGIFHVKLVSAF